MAAGAVTTGDFPAVMRIVAIASAAAAILAAAPASAATIQTYKVANWDVGAYTNNSTGRFTHCAASARYRNGLTLIFSVSEKLDWGISFLNPDWNLREGREIEIEYQIDNGRTNSATGRAVNARQIVAKLPDSAELFNQFRYGYRMVVSINDGRNVPFDLRDTNAMLTEVLRCANRHKGYVDRSGNRTSEVDPDRTQRDDDRTPRNDTRAPRSDDRAPPRADNRGPDTPQGFASGSSRRDLPDNRVARTPERKDEPPAPDSRAPQAPSSMPTVGPTPESRTEAEQLATDILRRANFDFQLQKADQLSENLRKYDAVWRADGVLGTLRVLHGARNTTIDAVRGSLIASDATTCKGKFASGALPAMSGSQSQTIFTSCEGEENWAVYYIATPRRKGGIYLLGISGSGEVASRLQNVANAYRTVALEVLEK